MPAATPTCEDRIRDYLGNGGLFNPELMEHEKVRELLIDCLDELNTRKRHLGYFKVDRDCWRRRAEKAEATNPT